MLRPVALVMLSVALFGNGASWAQAPAPIYATTYGMKCDGTTDDTGALTQTLNAANSALLSRAVEVVFPPGRCIFMGATTAVSAQHNVSIDGSGIGASTLVFDASDAFDVTSTNGSDVSFSGLQLFTGNTSSTYANIGLKITFSGASGRAILEHLELGDGAIPSVHAWANAIDLSQPRNSVIDDVRILMPNWVAGSTSGVGLSLEGTAGSSAPNFAIDNQVSHLFVQGGYQGVSVGSYVQGLYLMSPVLVGDDYGVYWNGTTSGDVPELLSVIGGELNSHTADIYGSKISLSPILGNEFDHYNPSGTSGGWSAIDIEGGNNLVIADNVILGVSAVSESGAILDNLGQTPNVVSGNSIAAINGPGIWFAGNTRMSIAAGNSVNGPQTSPAVEDSSGGFNLLGPIIYNGNPAPFLFDGANVDVLTALSFPYAGKATGLLTADKNGNLEATNSSNNGGLTVQGSTNFLTNAILHPNASLITQDQSGNAGYVAATGDGSLSVETARPSLNPGLRIPAGSTAGVGSCSSSSEGEMKTASDASSPTYGATYVGGGSSFALLVCNGSAWVVH